MNNSNVVAKTYAKAHGAVGRAGGWIYAGQHPIAQGWYEYEYKRLHSIAQWLALNPEVCPKARAAWLAEYQRRMDERRAREQELNKSTLNSFFFGR